MIKESCNLLEREHFGLLTCEPELSDMEFEQENRTLDAFPFTLLSAKSNDQMLVNSKKPYFKTILGLFCPF